MATYKDVKEEFMSQITTHPKVSDARQDIFQAFAFGEKKHAGQKRKNGNEPYFIHCTTVALSILKEPDVERDFVISALLHDTLEDTKTTVEELIQTFGNNVGLIVKTLTKLPSSMKKTMGTERYYEEGFFGPIVRVAQTVPFIWKIKLADRLHNLQTYWQFASPEKIEEYVWETNQILIFTRNVKTPLRDKIQQELTLHYK